MSTEAVVAVITVVVADDVDDDNAVDNQLDVSRGTQEKDREEEEVVALIADTRCNRFARR